MDSLSTDLGQPIRVWIGYGLDELLNGNREQFYQALGEIFIPATYQFMSPWGLVAYLPTVPPPDEDPIVPHEVALVCYSSQEAYHLACTSSVGGRAYVRLHQTLFKFESSNGKPTSHSGFPLRFDVKSTSLPKQGYYYLRNPDVNWSAGQVRVEIAVCTKNDYDLFREQLLNRLIAIEEGEQDNLDAVVVAVSECLVVLWGRWANESSPENLLEGLAARTVANLAARKIVVPMSPFAQFSGLVVQANSSMNVMAGSGDRKLDVESID